MMPKPNEQHRAILDDILLRVPGVYARKTFGSPAYYVEGKMFACVFGDSIALKLPEATIVEVLKREDAGPFQPGGKMMMRGWVRIHRSDSSHYREDEALLLQALEFVTELAKAAPAKKKAKGT